MIANGFETLGELDRRHAKLLREAQAWRLSRSHISERLDLASLPHMPKLRTLFRRNQGWRRPPIMNTK